MDINWEVALQASQHRLRSSAIRDLLAVTAQPDVISFAGGVPATELFPVEAIRVSFDAVLRADGGAALQYGPTEGHLPLRQYIADELSAQGIPATPEEILITTGSQQALDLLAKVLLPRNGLVAVESPSYVGALNALLLQEPRFLAVPMDGEGLQVDHLAHMLAGANDVPSLLYTVATFQNPSGVTMSAARRAALLALCAEHRIPLVEDNPYGELRYDGEAVTPIRALPGGEDSIYLGTFSKVLAPGLRVGYVVGPRLLIARLAMAKQAADLHTDALSQRAILHFCRHNDLPAHVERLRAVYRERRDAMLDALARHFPLDMRWTRPEGGLFLWVTLPEAISSQSVLRDAVAARVAFVPGSAFNADGTGANCMRLSFSNATPEQIEEGVRRLANVVGEHLRVAGESRTLQQTTA